jgi:pyruvate-ferredoxin/flavodoxin oxidoreductase
MRAPHALARGTTLAAGNTDNDDPMASSTSHCSAASNAACVALGSSDMQTLKAFNEAERWNGPSIIIAYSHCIAHGYDLVHGLDQQKLAVQTGHWPLFRYNPALVAEGKNPFVLDSKAPALPLEKYIYNETRYTMLVHSKPDEAKRLLGEAQADVMNRWRLYEQMASAPGEPVVGEVKAH